MSFLGTFFVSVSPLKNTYLSVVFKLVRTVCCPLTPYLSLKWPIVMPF